MAPTFLSLLLRHWIDRFVVELDSRFQELSSIYETWVIGFRNVKSYVAEVWFPG